jgi:hypothetical protein
LLLHKVEARLRVMGIEATRVPPPKVVLPLLEHATLENEDDLHTLWANLLTSGLDPSEEEIERTYVSVLAELSGRDGDVLRKTFAEWSYWEKEKEIGKETSDRYSSGVGWTSKHDETSVVKFYRLGIILLVNIEVEEYRDRAYIERSVSWREEDYVESGEKARVLGDLQVVAFTEFGERFCKAVIGDVTGVYKPPDWVKAK